MDLLTWTLIGTMISSVILSWYIAITHNSNKKKNYELRAITQYNLNQLKTKELNINSKIDSEIEIELDKFITDIVNEYILLNYAHTKNYLNAEECDKMFKEVEETVKKRLTPALFDKLCLYYNKSELGSIIVHKIYFSVLKFVMDRNNNVQIEMN